MADHSGNAGRECFQRWGRARYDALLAAGGSQAVRLRRVEPSESSSGCYGVCSLPARSIWYDRCDRSSRCCTNFHGGSGSRRGQLLNVTIPGLHWAAPRSTIQPVGGDVDCVASTGFIHTGPLGRLRAHLSLGPGGSDWSFRFTDDIKTLAMDQWKLVVIVLLFGLTSGCGTTSLPRVRTPL